MQLCITRPTYVAGRKKKTKTKGRCKGCKLKLGETSARFLSLTDTSVARRVEPSRADPIHSNPSQSSPKMPARNSNFISSPVLRPPFPVMSCLSCIFRANNYLRTSFFFCCTCGCCKELSLPIWGGNGSQFHRIQPNAVHVADSTVR